MVIRTISLEHYRSHIGPPLFEKHSILNVFDSFELKLGVFTSTRQIYFPKGTQITLSNITKYICILQEMLKITVFIAKKKKFSD